MTGEKENKSATGDILSTAQEDYIETIFNLSGELDKVRVTDIAERLGVRMPAVTRAVQGLEKLHMIERDDGRGICLTPLARKLAGALVHRHTDLVTFLTEVLGVDERIAEADTCQMEHGAEAPKRFMPMTTPSWPVYRSQPKGQPASTATRAVTARGRTDSR